MFEVIFLIAITIYFIQTIVFTIGINKKFSQLNEDSLPTASVIVAARNEEKNIQRCLESLDKLEYPENKLEIIIVDDKSDDRTGEIVESFIINKKRFKKIISTKQYGSVKGKANAIANAIDIATGEIILTTDADCTVNKLWVKSIASYFTKDVAVVCGFTNQRGESIFKSMQSVDFIYLLSVASGAMNLDKPLSCIGNNMAYRKEVYNAIGGYASIPFSVTEDFKLLFTIYNLKKYKIIYPIDEKALVTSEPCNNNKMLYRQKKRWGVGGLDSKLSGFLVMATGFLCHVGILISPFFYSPTILALILFKVFIDYFFLYPVHRKLKINFNLKSFLMFQIYFIIYVIGLPILLIFSKKVYWKGREY